MKKKLIAFLAGLSMLAALTGCGEKAVDPVASNDVVAIEQYKGLEVKAVEPAEVTEEEIDASIEYTLQVTAAEYGITDRAAEDGDTVIIDYEGKLDGVAFEGGTSQGYALGLGSGTFIPGFEEQIVGHMPGETFDINVTFPENYGNEELNGAETVFTIKLHSIVPTGLTDEIATALVGAATTVEEYRETVRADLEVSNQATAESDYINSVYAKFMENCTLKNVSDEEIEEWVKIVEESYSMYAAYAGMETDEYLKQYYGVTCEDLAKEQICFNNAIALVAETEGITLTLEEYDETVALQAANYGYEDPAEYEAAYDEAYGEGALQEYLLQEKVLNWIAENSVTVE